MESFTLNFKQIALVLSYLIFQTKEKYANISIMFVMEHTDLPCKFYTYVLLTWILLFYSNQWQKLLAL